MPRYQVHDAAALVAVAISLAFFSVAGAQQFDAIPPAGAFAGGAGPQQPAAAPSQFFPSQPLSLPQLDMPPAPSAPLPGSVAGFQPAATDVELAVAVDGELTDSERLKALEKKFADFQRSQPPSYTSTPLQRDEFPTFRITGFTQLDGGWFDQSANNIATVGNAQDGVDFRRVRLAVVGRVAEFTNYMVEVDFATAGRPSFFDIWAEQTNIPYLGAIRGGQYCQPFSVDALTGFRNLTFLERSLPFLAFVPFRRVGFMAYNSTEDQRLNWAYSVFRTGGFQNAPLGDDRFATDIGDVGGYSFTERTTYLLYYDDAAPDRYLWTIGGSYDFSQISANTGTGNPNPTVPFYQARTTPEFGPLGNSDTSQNFGQSFATNPVYVDTGKYLASSFNIYGAETVAQAGPWGFTSEWMATSVNSTVGPVFYHGAYAQVAYRLTGENRTFDKRTATLGKVIPYTDFFSFTGPRRGIVGWGAWEIAARWSYVSLINPGNLQYLPGSSGVGSGRLDDSTLGLTWFWNAYMKWQFNWIHAELHNMQRGYSVGDLFVTRLHIDF